MKITTEELMEWLEWYKQYKNGYHMSDYDWGQFVRLNHLVLETASEIHNYNMLNGKDK